VAGGTVLKPCDFRERPGWGHVQHTPNIPPALAVLMAVCGRLLWPNEGRRMAAVEKALTHRPPLAVVHSHVSKTSVAGISVKSFKFSPAPLAHPFTSICLPCTANMAEGNGLYMITPQQLVFFFFFFRTLCPSALSATLVQL
jgi:hypothetical protein